MELTKDIEFGYDEVEVPKSFHQLGILVLDGSGSMSGSSANGNQTKSEAVHSAVKELLSCLKASNNFSNFSIAIVTFDHRAKVHTPITPLVDIDDLGDFNPLVGHGGGTDIGNALTEAKLLIEKHLLEGTKESNEGIPHQAVVIVLSDGMSSGEPKVVAQEIKDIGSDVVIASTLFASKGESYPQAIEILKDIASDPIANYTTVYDAEALRNFFVASLSLKVK